MERRRMIVMGSALVLLGVAGIGQAIRAGWAQAMYHDAKYGSGRTMSPEETDSLCARAYRLYRHNVYFSIWTAEKAYYDGSDEALTPGRLAIAERWCDLGLRQNAHKRSLRLLKTYLLLRDDPAAALSWWKRYVDWHFWSPFNHSVLAELYALNGDDFRARQSMTWVVGSSHEAATRKAIQAAWRRDVMGP